MSYFFSKQLDCGLDEAVARVTAALQREGFGVLVEIDLHGTLKAKLGVDTPGYRILGACNPPLAYLALQAEPQIGLMLPCNVTVREIPGGAEVAAIDPVAAMAPVENAALADVARQVAAKLRSVVDSL